MIELTVTGDLTTLIREVEDRYLNMDLRGLAEIIKGIMIEDNASARMEGIDAEGTGMAPVTEATIRRGRGGDGPPLVPRNDGSRAINDFTVEIIPIGDGAFSIIGQWADTPFIRYHTGPARMSNGNIRPARDIVGLRPACMERINEAVQDWFEQ